MRCAAARRALFEIGPRGENARSHASVCAGCGAELREWSRIAEDLALLRLETEKEVDVTARVLARLPDESSVVRAPVSARTLAWLGSTVAAVTVGASTLLVLNAASLLRAARVGTDLAKTILVAAEGALDPVGRVAIALGEAGVALIAVIFSSSEALTRFAPPFEGCLLVATFLITLATAAAVVRDVRRREADFVEEERDHA